MAFIEQPTLDPSDPLTGLYCPDCGHTRAIDRRWLRHHGGERIGCGPCGRHGALPSPDTRTLSGTRPKDPHAT